ncbi:MAG: SpoIID/LytB domain-containing protein [Calditrichaeota bacterium]|nr:MAG: SpoIID/LytB domain-containing protein [Calditrichota bacterium]
MAKHRGILTVVVLLILFTLIYWIVVYRILHKPDIPSEPNIFALVEPNVRVRILNTADNIHLQALSDWLIKDGTQGADTSLPANSQLTISLSPKNKLVLETESLADKLVADSLRLHSAVSGGELLIQNVPFGVGWWWEGKEDRVYEGELLVFPGDKQRIDVVVRLPLEAYLCGVVPYEIGADAPKEALKAQAIAARSEALMALRSGLYKGTHYDLTSDVECQVFAGNSKRTAQSDSAVYDTRGLSLFCEDEPIHAYYASNCGGHSEIIENVWPDRPRPATYTQGNFDSETIFSIDLSSEKLIYRWLMSSPDVYCNPEYYKALPSWSRENFRWKKEFTTASLSMQIAKHKDIGMVQEIKVLKRGVSGRISAIRFIGDSGYLDVNSELAIRQIWRPPLRSSCFFVDEQGGLFTILGAGWGHGVGMCQSGAIAQAHQGEAYDEILAHYYRDSQLKLLY